MWIDTKNHMVVMLQGREPKIVNHDSPIYSKVREMINSNDKNSCDVEELLFPEQQIEIYTNGDVEMDSTGAISVDGKTTDPALAKLIQRLIEECAPYQPLVNLQRNIDKIENEWVRGQLFRFLEKNKIALTDDGCFIAYKKVNRNDKGILVDVHTGNVCNEVGSKPTMLYYDVDNNPHNTCSRGLHVAGFGYMSQYDGDVIVAVKVNPRNVISIPYDYDSQKIRTCQYEVLAEIVDGKEIEDCYFPWDKKVEKKEGKETGTSTTGKKGNKNNSMINIMTLSATKIIDYVKSVTKKLIPVSPKSKQSVVNHALKILEAAGVKVNGTQIEVDLNDLVDESKGIIYLNGLNEMSSRELVDFVKAETGEEITISLKSKASILKHAEQILKVNGYRVE